MLVPRTLRIVAAVAALIAGYAHIKLYNDGYKDIPIANIGTQFLLNALSAVVIAAGLLAPLVVTKLPSWVSWSAPAAGIGWAAMSLLAFAMSRTSTGWMGFRDGPGLNPAPEAALSVFPEIAVLVCCLALVGIVLVGRQRSTVADS